MNKARKNTSEDQSQPKSNVTFLPFRPLTGFGSPHIQTVIACFSRGGTEPPTNQLIIPVDHENALSCEVSTPPNWKKTDKTISFHFMVWVVAINQAIW